jgi:hypothetical protein
MFGDAGKRLYDKSFALGNSWAPLIAVVCPDQSRSEAREPDLADRVAAFNQRIRAFQIGGVDVRNATL